MESLSPDAPVQNALKVLEQVDSAELSDHPALFETIHAQLREALQQTGTP